MRGLLGVIEQLQAFALADRVVAEDGEAVLGHEDAGSLIRLGRLAVVAVAARDEDAGEGALAGGDVEIGGDVMIGPALVDHLLDAEAIAFERADDLGVERRLGREAADRVDEFRLQLALAVCGCRQAF